MPRYAVQGGPISHFLLVYLKINFVKVAYRAPLADRTAHSCSFMLKVVTFDTFAGVGKVRSGV